jgi:hypothetical protein
VIPSICQSFPLTVRPNSLLQSLLPDTSVCP